MMTQSLRTTHFHRLIALVLSVLWLAQSGVYPAVVAAAETLSGAHRVDVVWSSNHATVALRHDDAPQTVHHHGLTEKMLLLNATDGQHPDHLLNIELPQITCSNLKADIQRVDLISDLIFPPLTLALRKATADRAHWVATAEQATCPRTVDVWRSVRLLV